MSLVRAKPAKTVLDKESLREVKALFPLLQGEGVGGEGRISISALQQTGLSQLVTTVRDHLVPPADLQHPGPWRFDDRLTQSA